MGAKISKHYSYKSQLKIFKLVLNFFPNGPHKTTFGIFKILKIDILTIFLSQLGRDREIRICPLSVRPCRNYL